MRRAARTGILVAAVAAAALLATDTRAKKGKAGKPRIAVLEFTNASTDAGLDALGKGLQSMVTTDLSKVAALDLVERARLREVEAELKLGRSEKIDRKTAARFGKLSGATHLLGGTFTVVGDTMRLDARLLTVEQGKVLLAEEITGERDAFFELEKALVRKLVTALGLKLAPKERAGIARIHTADFEAFRRFSAGVDHFDQGRYDKAIDELRAASRVDAGFALAKDTLGRYEQVAAEIRLRAQRLETKARLEAAAAQDEVAVNDAAVEAKLYAIVDAGPDRDPARWFAAMAYLIGFHDVGGRNHGRVSRFQDRGDVFVSRRTADLLGRRWLAEAAKRWPLVPLFPTSRHPPDTPDLVEKRVDGLAGALTGKRDRDAKARTRRLADNLRRADRVLKLFAANPKLERQIRELALEKLIEIGADPHPIEDAFEELAELHERHGDLDAASALLARLSARTDKPRTLKEAAKRIEALGKLAELIDSLPRKAEARELLLILGERPSSHVLEGLRAPAGAPVLGTRLSRERRLKGWSHYHEDAWRLGGLAAFALDGDRWLETGPRTDPVTSGSLVYHRDQERPDEDALVLIGELPREDLEASLQIDFTPPAGWWPARARADATSLEAAGLDPGRPEVGLAFGLRDIQRKCGRDPETRERRCPSPTRGWLLRLTPAGASLERVGEAAPAEEQRAQPVALEVVARKPAALGERRSIEIHVEITGERVEVRASGLGRARFTLPEPTRGYVALWARGPGFARFSDVTLK